VEITLEVLYYKTLCETKFDLILFYVFMGDTHM